MSNGKKKSEQPAKRRKRFYLGHELTVSETVEATARHDESVKRSVTTGTLFHKSPGDDDPEDRREGYLLCNLYGGFYYIPIDKIIRRRIEHYAVTQ
jgi:hypothetical protein